jgi:hypothetical protein
MIALAFPTVRPTECSIFSDVVAGATMRRKRESNKDQFSAMAGAIQHHLIVKERLQLKLSYESDTLLVGAVCPPISWAAGSGGRKVVNLSWQ